MNTYQSFHKSIIFKGMYSFKIILYNQCRRSRLKKGKSIISTTKYDLLYIDNIDIKFGIYFQFS